MESNQSQTEGRTQTIKIPFLKRKKNLNGEFLIKENSVKKTILNVQMITFAQNATVIDLKRRMGFMKSNIMLELRNVNNIGSSKGLTGIKEKRKIFINDGLDTMTL